MVDRNRKDNNQKAPHYIVPEIGYIGKKET
jgi:hypothetical protein